MTARSTPSAKTIAEEERARRHRSYMEGWRDGAGLRAMSQERMGTLHECDYTDGYTRGCQARNGAMDDATIRYDYSPDQVYLASWERR